MEIIKKDLRTLWKTNSLISCFGLILMAIFKLINYYFYSLFILLIISLIFLFKNEVSLETIKESPPKKD